MVYTNYGDNSGMVSYTHITRRSQQPSEPSNLSFFLYSQSSGKTQLRSIASNTDSLMAKSDHQKQTALVSTVYMFLPPSISQS